MHVQKRYTILRARINTGHGGRDKMLKEVNKLSLRQAVSSFSLCDGQGFTRCGCSTTGKTRCSTKRCLCKKSGLLCNSRCPPNITCSNK